jgi:hypothetical protein
MRMRWVVLAAAALVSACTKPDVAPDAAAASRTVFVKAAPVVGARRQESSELVMTIAMTVDGRHSDMSVSESVKRTEEILAVSGDAVTKAKVTFDSVQSTQPSTIAGKTFIVEAKDGKLDVRDDQGKAALAADAKDVERHLKNVGKAEPMLTALPAIGVMPGQKVDGVARAIADQLRESGDGMTVSDVVVTFKEQRGDTGVFDVALKLSRDDGTMKMEIAVKGDAWVSTKTSWPTKLDLSGPVTIAAGQAKTDGSGKMSMKLEAKNL